MAESRLAEMESTLRQNPAGTGGPGFPYPLVNVRETGATGNGITDDTDAIQAAINLAVSSGRGGILIPGGIFVCRLVVGIQASFDINGLGGLHIEGIGDDSILQFMSQDAALVNWSLFRFRGGSAQIIVSDLTIDGNAAGVVNPAVTTRPILIQDARDITVQRCWLRNSPSRGIQVGRGVAEMTLTPCARNRILDCKITGNVNEGIMLPSGSDGLLISRTEFDGNGAEDISAVPVTGPSPVRMLIDDCIMDKGATSGAVAINLSATGVNEGVERSRISNCSIRGRVLLERFKDVAFEHNTVECGSAIVGQSAIDLRNAGSRALIHDNTVVTTDVANGIRSTIGGGATENTLLSIRDNEVRLGGAGVGISTDAADRIAIKDNIIIAGAATCLNAITVVATAAIVDCIIADNECYADLTGGGGPWVNSCLDITPSVSISKLRIVDNQFRNHPAAGAVNFFAGTYVNKPFMHDNQCDSGGNLVSTWVNVGHAIVGGAGYGDGTNDPFSGTQFIGLGSPEGVVVASRGSTYQRLDGGVLTNFYVKTTDFVNTGWLGIG